MRLTPGLFVVLVLAAIVFFAVPILGSASACSEADERFDNHLTAEAEKAYRKILGDDPDNDCAARGMNDVIMRRCREAGELLKDGAETAYLKLLATESPSIPPYRARTCAFDGLEHVRHRQQLYDEIAKQQQEKTGDDAGG